MLKFTELQLRRGSRILLEHVNLTIHAGQKIGLIGANGTGKSSFFELILGHLEADAGDVELPRDWRIAHLAQEVPASDRIARDYVLDGDAQLRAVQQAIEEAERNEDFHRLGELHERLDSLDGHTANSRAEQLLLGLGFTGQDFVRPLNRFSGGWRIRLNLAQTLMRPSDLILLDEPTNHLDLDAILWFERWLRAYQGTVLLVSHDREFLDRVTTGIAHVYARSIELYPGNYSQFERLRAAKLAVQQAAYEKQQTEIEHMQEFVRRFRYKASKARQAQSRIKALQRMEAIAAAHIDSPFRFSIPQADKTSNPLLVLEQAELGYGDVSVLRDTTVQIHPGDRIGLLGPNGAGKSTLIRSLAGDLSLLSGRHTAGSHLRIGYFSQHQVDDLDLAATPMAHLRRLSPHAKEQSLRTFLGGFGFSGEKALEAVCTFSGGEKARLALATIAWQKPNLLLLDEPTNHLDIDMRQALTVALQDYQGAMVLVSHDRHLLRNTVDTFLLVNRQRVRIFDGDLEDYQSWLDLPLSAPDSVPKPANRAKLDRQRLRSVKAGIAALEKRLERLQGKLQEVEEQLGDATLYSGERGGDLQDLLRNRESLVDEIQQTEREWLQHSSVLEDLHTG
ncbi:MAG: ATP-binding cassette domain-containing protein [Gammaproteobacteria bacterium]|nr:ATP-binding cassette domain-containing protein [Gammaproteobacteria bacterium]